jgi:hypothetical protein
LKNRTAKGEAVFFSAIAAANAMHGSVVKMRVEAAAAIATEPTRLPVVEMLQLRASSPMFSFRSGCVRNGIKCVRKFDVIISVLLGKMLNQKRRGRRQQLATRRARPSATPNTCGIWLNSRIAPARWVRCNHG